MRDLKLTLVFESRHVYHSIQDLGSVRVDSYNDLWNIIKEKMEKDFEDEGEDEEGKYTWIRYMKEFMGEEDEDVIRDEMLEGSFDDLEFVVGVGEEGSVVCVDVNSNMINEKPEDILEKVLNKVYNLS